VASWKLQCQSDVRKKMRACLEHGWSMDGCLTAVLPILPLQSARLDGTTTLLRRTTLSSLPSASPVLKINSCDSMGLLCSLLDPYTL
jgi:hypothetical protein